MVVLIVYLYFPAHGRSLGPGPRSRPSIWVCRPWLPIFIYRSRSLICIYRSWRPICVYRPWPPICIYQPWSSSLYLPSLGQICIYQSWPPMCVYPNVCLPQCVFIIFPPWSLNCVYQPWLWLCPPTCIYQSRSKCYYYHSYCSQICIRRPLLEPLKSGRLIKHLYKTTTKQMWSLLAGF